MAKHLRLGLCITIVASIAFTAALTAACHAAPAQKPPVAVQPAPPQASTVQLDEWAGANHVFQPDSDSGLIRLDVDVTDQQGQAVTGLTEKDLTLFDNGQPQEIVTFQDSKPQPPVEIILVLDELDRPGQLAEELAAQKFLRKNGGHLAQPVKVYRLGNDGLFASAQPTTDGNALASEVEERKEPRRIWNPQELDRALRMAPYGINLGAPPNALWTNLPHSLIALGSIAIEERRSPERKLLFWFGSGWPVNQKRWDHLFDTVTELSTRLREARIGLWVDDFWSQTDNDAIPYQNFLAGVTSEESLTFQNLALQVLAVQSGGGVLQGEGDAADLISRHVAQANTFYTITFDPPRSDVVDEYHDLKVKIGKPGFTTNTRTGYYNEPALYDQAPTGVEHLTVAQLFDAISALRNASESQSAQRLKRIQLLERLSSTDLAKLLLTLKGNKEREALIALADQSAFLPPPAGDILNRAAPSFADQKQIVRQTVDYVSNAVPILPDLSAERTTTLYLEPARVPGQTWKTAAADQSLYPASTAKVSIHVSNEEEITQGESFKKGPMTEQNRTLETKGTFGPILASVLVGLAKRESKLNWSRWESGAQGPLAVFRYQVPAGTFHVGFCCLAVDSGQIQFEDDAPSHGEITVDPTSGAILRLTIQADLAWRLPLERSDIMVEYSPVTLGDRSYFCPARSVSISRQRSVVELNEYGEMFKIYAPFETVLNDMSFDKYHLFRSTSRVLPGFTEAPEAK